MSAVNNSLNCSLTSLNWLQKLGCRTSGLARPLASAASQRQVVQKIFPTQKERLAAEKKRKQATKAAANKVAAALKAANGGGGGGGGGGGVGGGSKNGKTTAHGINWNANSTDKPPHCYATLIYMAMRSLRKEKVTLGEIYTYVKSNFLFYKTVSDNGWKNSIRHNLTQHSCFVKVQRTDEHPGKGGYWRLSPDYQGMFTNGVFKRKRRKTGGSSQSASHSSSHSSSQSSTTHNIKHTGSNAGKSQHASSSSTSAGKLGKRKPLKLKVLKMALPFKWDAGGTAGAGTGAGVFPTDGDEEEEEEEEEDYRSDDYRDDDYRDDMEDASSMIASQIPEEIEHLEGIDYNWANIDSCDTHTMMHDGYDLPTIKQEEDHHHHHHDQHHHHHHHHHHEHGQGGSMVGEGSSGRAGRSGRSSSGGGGRNGLGDHFGGSGGDGSSMLNALTLMDGTPSSTGSPTSILPDINQNDGSGTPEGPSYTFHELQDEIDYGKHYGLKPQPLLSIQQQIKQVESTLDLSGNIAEMAKMDTMSWNGQDLTVRGIGLNLVEGVVPCVDGGSTSTHSKMLQAYNHITPDDLHDLDLAPMPSDWII